MVLTYSQAPAFGTPAPEFSLPGVDGKTYTLADFKNAKALVVVFMCNHCPYVIATQDRINQLAREYAVKGVKLVAISSNDSVKYPADDFASMKKRAKEKNYSFPYLWDESQEVAKAYGAVCTPEFFAYKNVGGKYLLSYLGRLDDNWKDESAVKSRDLALALDAILAGEEPLKEQKPAMGCNIKWK